MIGNYEQIAMAAYPDTYSPQDEPLGLLVLERTEPVDGAVSVTLPAELAPEGQFAETPLPNGERLGVPLHEYAAAYLDRMLINPDNEDIPDEAASLRDLQATPEQRQVAREIVVAECAKPHVERMALPLVRLGDFETLEHEIRVGALLALINTNRTAVEAGLIHDDGKAFVYSVISKPGKLTESEREWSKLHVPGTLILARQVGLTDRQVLVDVNEHHDNNADPAANYIGSEELLPDSEESREEAVLVKLADEFDALKGRRGYKPALPSSETVQIMERQIAAPRTAWDKFYRLVGHTDRQVD